MFKLPIQNHYIRDKLSEHDFYKPLILEEISEQEDPNLFDFKNGGENNISKLDWENHSDFDRPWVKKLLPALSNKLAEMSHFIGYNGIALKAIWYQQYLKDSIHGWHVHSENYTGVYYLEYPADAPPTELWDNKLKIPEVSEGDVVMFPAMTPHRAPMVKNDIRKTIVSFNFNVIELNTKRLKEFKKEGHT
jgi:hypothetical protein|tara:strand:+ start:1472 stop:2044 length:573 start_codon:yes stop_codon:yes gene_type:complete